jgi:hypothetical protein
LEALWAVTFGTRQDFGAGVIVFETRRIFGGDSCFYYVGHYDYNTRDHTISGEVEVTRHTPGAPFIVPGRDGGRFQLNGHVDQPTMILTGHLAEDPQQPIGVHCQHLQDLP